jgi:methylated-DNA-protein-cysteine methyltransferase related protein
MARRRERLPEGWGRFYRVVRRIPRGRVATYGAVAEWAGWPRAARQVGYAMAALHGTAHEVPWHRVVGARPRKRAAISIKDPTGGAIQRQRLLDEGVKFDDLGRISLGDYGWSGPRRSKETKASSS